MHESARIISSRKKPLPVARGSVVQPSSIAFGFADRPLQTGNIAKYAENPNAFCCPNSVGCSSENGEKKRKKKFMRL